jgi:hypothetical protein
VRPLERFDALGHREIGAASTATLLPGSRPVGAVGLDGGAAQAGKETVVQEDLGNCRLSVGPTEDGAGSVGYGVTILILTKTARACA